MDNRNKQSFQGRGTILKNNVFLEIGYRQLNKAGEELCGDTVEVQITENSIIIVLSDGLGSGVKANILSGLTAKTAATMLKLGGRVEEVVETMAHTLPVCKVRDLAYSTFTILQILDNGWVYLAEYDNPPVFLGHNNKLKALNRRDLVIGDKTVKESYFKISQGDWLVLISDGVLHAGIGGVWNLGWGWDRVGNYLENIIQKDEAASDWASQIAGICNKLYGEKPGDDASIVVIKARQVRHLTILAGPPRNYGDDHEVVSKLVNAPGMKAICGGATSNLVSRVAGRELKVTLNSGDPRVPPMGEIPGIDLVTEGMITLFYALEHINNKQPVKSLRQQADGASQLAAVLLAADEIHFIVGLAINPATNNPGLPAHFALKHKTIRDIIQTMTSLGKKVSVEYH